MNTEDYTINKKNDEINQFKKIIRRGDCTWTCTASVVTKQQKIEALINQELEYLLKYDKPRT